MLRVLDTEEITEGLVLFPVGLSAQPVPQFKATGDCRGGNERNGDVMPVIMAPCATQAGSALPRCMSYSVLPRSLQGLSFH
jgi:hypothetical protein